MFVKIYIVSMLIHTDKQHRGGRDVPLNTDAYPTYARNLRLDFAPNGVISPPERSVSLFSLCVVFPSWCQHFGPSSYPTFFVKSDLKGNALLRQRHCQLKLCQPVR